MEYTLCCSLARAFALYAAISCRYGGEQNGPDYDEQVMIAELVAREKANQPEKPTWAR